MTTSWRTRYAAWLTERGFPWRSPRTATTSTPRIGTTTTVSNDSWRSGQTQTTLFSPEMGSMYATPDGLQIVTVNIGLREDWRDWQISSVVTHSRSLSLTLTRTPSPR